MSEDIINSKCYFCKEDLFHYNKCSFCPEEYYFNLLDNKRKKSCQCITSSGIYVKCKKCLINFSHDYLLGSSSYSIFFYINDYVFEYLPNYQFISYRGKFLKIPNLKLKSIKDCFKLANKFVKLNEIT